MLTLTDFYPQVALECPGVPVPILDNAIRRAMRRFCERTHAYRKTYTVTTTATVSGYSPLGVDVDLLGVKEFYDAGGSDIKVAPLASLNKLTAASRKPEYYAVSDGPDEPITLYPTPDATYALTLVAAVKPSRTATSFDDVLMTWEEAIVAYAKYLLQGQVDRPWTDHDAAARNLRRFGTLVTEAFWQQATDNGATEVFVRQRPAA